MGKKVSNYIHRERLHWGLNQDELARLLGLRSRSSVSNLERDTRSPSHRALIAGAIAFGLSPPDLFSGLYDEIEDSVVTVAYQMLEELDAKKSRSAGQKRELLEGIISRASKRNLAKNNVK